MKTLMKPGLAAAVCVLLSAGPALASGYLRINNVVADIGVVNEHGMTPNSPNDLLFDVDLCAPEEPNPVLAPDGHQLTWGEWSQVTGRASLRCGPNGTHVVIQLSGLIPKGVYTMWVFVFEPPGFAEAGFGSLIGAGALGASDGSRSFFIASASGQAAIAVHHPPGDLSVRGQVGSCLFDEFEVHLVGAYHLDGQVYGPIPAPSPCLWTPHFGFVLSGEP